LDLLGYEYEYITQSSLHTDDLRDRFTQYYLILVGAAFTVMLGIAQLDNTTVHPIVFALISFVLFLVGLILVFIFARLRKIVVESMLASALIKEYYKTRVAPGAGLQHALLWDGASVPEKEKLTTASFLLVLMVIILNSAMLGAAVFFLLGGSNLKPGESIFVVIAVSMIVVAVFALSCMVQSGLYMMKVNREIMRVWERFTVKKQGAAAATQA
jgi:hypothetical protein